MTVLTVLVREKYVWSAAFRSFLVTQGTRCCSMPLRF